MALAGGGATVLSFSAIAIHLSGASPTTVAVFRTLYALPLLGLIAYLHRLGAGAQAIPPPWLPTLACGAFLALDFVFWHATIEYLGAGLATVLTALGVTLVPILAWLLLAERPNPRYFAWLPAIGLGAVLIAGVFEGAEVGSNPGLGLTLGVGSAVTYAGFILLLRSITGLGRGTALTLFKVTVVALVVSVAIGIATSDLDPVPSWPETGWLALVACTSQVLAWMMVARALPRISAVTISALLLIQPLGSLFLAAILLGESPTSLQFCGTVIVLVAVLGVAILPGSEAAAEEELATP